ncbi:hypothetical protein [Phytohabitans rumicis]|uniref:DUF998 domain-containing protein n=1 Tax=Phytohabitans rumicis TaxID=1076125 RepID=A0A6V8LLB7_9ACTN|nr:hypothetical protein [Phytohabitans rumicis]GFJ95668.1 hypothetical protein Prum_093100 [Phytohabitans rumicis]
MIETIPLPRDLRDETDPAVLYRKSYLLIRIVLGFLGIALPIVFIIGEWLFLRGGVHVRGSLSAYYHSSMRDVFVAGLCVTGFLLLTYMAAERRTPDFWISVLAGVAVIGVAFFPTWRPGLADGAPHCGTSPEPAGCSAVQQEIGEGLTATIHYTCAVIFILSLAVIAYLFSRRDKARNHEDRAAMVQRICMWVIIGAVAFVAVGKLLDITIGELTPLYLGEVLSVWAFGVSWLLAARDLPGKLIGYTPPDGAYERARM